MTWGDLVREAGEPPSVVTIQTMTPLRLMSAGRPVTVFDPSHFLRQVIRRCSALADCYGEVQLDTDFRQLSVLSRQVSLLEEDLRWQGGGTMLSGLAGSVTLGGVVGDFWPWLVLGQHVKLHSLNTGVPHAILFVEEAAKADVRAMGAAIRYHDVFKPKGTNANFVQITGPDRLRLRTYERGVEAETLACGTGMVAAGLIAGKLGRVTTPVKVPPASGDVLGWIDLQVLVPRKMDPDSVANGIAYDAEHDRLFVTGKNWPQLFEIRLLGP